MYLSLNGFMANQVSLIYARSMRQAKVLAEQESDSEIQPSKSQSVLARMGHRGLTRRPCYLVLHR